MGGSGENCGGDHYRGREAEGEGGGSRRKEGGGGKRVEEEEERESWVRVFRCTSFPAASHSGHPRVVPQQVVRKLGNGVVVECTVEGGEGGRGKREGQVGGAGGRDRREQSIMYAVTRMRSFGYTTQTFSPLLPSLTLAPVLASH